MAWYLVRAKPKAGKLVKLRRKLDLGDVAIMRPFGAALNYSLKNAKETRDGYAVWEEDYCSPPLAQEMKAILNEFFRDLSIMQEVKKGQGWKRIENLPSNWI